MATASSSSSSAGLRAVFRALRFRNYRLFFGGQSISLIGTWLTRVATSWLVYRLTGSALQLGIVSFAGQISHAASANTVIQTLVDDDKRGRVMSLFGMAFMGTAPFGSLLAGTLADAPRMGPKYTVAFTAACCLFAAAIFLRKLPALRQLVRPIYIQKGILPEVATAFQATSQLQTAAEE